MAPIPPPTGAHTQPQQQQQQAVAAAPFQGDMASQQRVLQSYMDSMFANVPMPSTSAGNNNNNSNNTIQQQQNQPFNAQPQMPAGAGGGAGQQQQQQMFHPGVPAIFQPGANLNQVSQESQIPAHSHVPGGVALSVREEYMLNCDTLV